MELIEAPKLEIEDLPLPFDWTENLTSKSIFIQNMDGIKDDHLLEDFVKRQIEKSDDIQTILTKPSLAQVSPQPEMGGHDRTSVRTPARPSLRTYSGHNFSFSG